MTLQLKFPKMACSACVNTITTVKIIAPTATVQAELKNKIVSVETQAPKTVIKEANAHPSA